MRSWETIADELRGLGVERVGLSPDTVELAKGMRDKYTLSLRLLSDAGLDVTDLYNLRYTDGKTPIVTTLLIDPDGVIRWVDLSPTYRDRTPADRVLAAVRAATDASALTTDHAQETGPPALGTP